MVSGRSDDGQVRFRCNVRCASNLNLSLTLPLVDVKLVLIYDDC